MPTNTTEQKKRPGGAAAADDLGADSQLKSSEHSIPALGLTFLRYERGNEVLRRMVTKLYKLRKLLDEKVPDPDAARDALRDLKELVVSHDLYVEQKKSGAARRQELPDLNLVRTE